MTEDTGIQRYSVTTDAEENSDGEACLFGAMQEDDDGDYVKWEDYQRIVQGARDLMDRAEANMRNMMALLNDAKFDFDGVEDEEK